MTSFVIRLTETMVWCEQKLSLEHSRHGVQLWRSHWRTSETIVSHNLATCLRSTELQPVELKWDESAEILSPYAPIEKHARFFYQNTEAEREVLVEKLVRERAELLKKGGRYPADLIPGLNTESNKGRLLFYAPDNTDHGGASFVETEGFFDTSDLPPWDTWVCYVPESAAQERIYFESHGWVTNQATNGYLVCWIPSESIEVVADGIMVDPMASLKWASDVDNEFTRQLQKDFLNLPVKGD